MGGIGQWLEQLVGGRGSAKLGPGIEDMKNAGNQQADFGQGITQQGLDRFNNLGGQYQGLIDQGGLSNDIRSQFNVARGAIGDQQVRGNRDFAARLSQRFSQSGGQLSPTAMTEYGLENQQNQGESAFSATNALNMNEAQMGLTNTNALFGRLQGVADSISGIGQNQQEMAFRRQMGALQMRFNRNKAIADNVSSYFGGGKMGGGGAAGGGVQTGMGG